MPLPSQQDSLQPSPDSSAPARPVGGTMSLLMKWFIEGFASCAVGFHPNLLWLEGEHRDHDKRSNCRSLVIYRPLPPEITPGENVTKMPTTSRRVSLTAEHDREK
jgi:hypothetical protein